LFVSNLFLYHNRPVKFSRARRLHKTGRRSNSSQQCVR